MSEPTFFFDTADTNYIRKTWDKLGKHIDGESVIGITTNPSALAKVNCDTLNKFEKLVTELCELVHDIRGQSAFGLVYVQVPNSLMDPDEIIEWAKYIKQFNGNGAAIALKIPHFNYAVQLTEDPEFHELYVNVTGVADAGTIVKSMGFNNIFFGSIIPGRMEEVGIDANSHLEFLANTQFHKHQNIIAGSMRTIEGLRNSIYYHTVPTIGSRVWDIIDTENGWEQFASYWEYTYSAPEYPVATYPPFTTGTNIDLSKQFFDQMDILGESIYKEFIGK
jgi:hypothetical protein